MSGNTRSVPLSIVVALLVVTGLGTAAGTSAVVTESDPAPVTGIEGSLDASEHLTVESQSLIYEGTDVTALELTVSNDATEDLDGDVHVAIYDDAGELRVSTEVVRTFDGKDAADDPAAETTVTVDVEAQHVEDVVQIEATVRER